MNRPKVSICLPTLNARRFLPERMASIICQAEVDWELIVCDSYSEDGTWEYLQTFAADSRIRLYQVPKEGLYAGWNECLTRARGEYIYIATADDTMESDCLLVLKAALEQFPDVDIALSQVTRIDASGDKIPSQQPEIWSMLNPQQSFVERVPSLAFFILLCGFASGFGSITGLLVRRSLFEKTGPFPTDLWFLGDCEWALRAVLHSDVIVLPNRLATWRSHGDQASSAWNLKAACLFLRSLERVLESGRHHFPVRWRSVPNWTSCLLQPRQMAAELSTKLTLGNLFRKPRQFLRWMFEAACVAPNLLLRRMRGGFSLSARHKLNAVANTKTLLSDFGETWPEQRILIPQSIGPFSSFSPQ
jgi:glycosyltransferase involved in cell wall biosynthesis